MLVVMNANATEGEVAGVVRVIETLGLRAHVMPGANRTAIGITGNKGVISLQHFENLPGVAEAIRVTKPYKLITLDLKQERTIVDVGGAKIGNSSLATIAGPCAIESRKQAFAIAEVVKGVGAKFFRGGAFKPRTSPYAFAGLGEEALKILVEIRDKFGLKIVSEALDEPFGKRTCQFLQHQMVRIFVQKDGVGTHSTVDLCAAVDPGPCVGARLRNGARNARDECHRSSRTATIESGYETRLVVREALYLLFILNDKDGNAITVTEWQVLHVPDEPHSLVKFFEFHREITQDFGLLFRINQKMC